ncbi:MAG: hypothetical protein M1155_01390 [Patescibacteria group bacterium]|nr:hypothetical protein [Patescibacteria group bacterium]
MNRRGLRKRDNVAEMIMKEVLSEMHKDGKIAGFIHSKRSDDYDVMGIDFMLFLNNDLALPIQVKTYSRNIKRCLEKHCRLHPLIKFVIFVKIGFYNRRPETAAHYLEKEIEGFIKQCLSRQ